MNRICCHPFGRIRSTAYARACALWVALVAAHSGAYVPATRVSACRPLRTYPQMQVEPQDACLPQIIGLPQARRNFMDMCRLSTGACLIFSGSSRSSALLPPGESAADGVGQNLRKVAASIPGMGPPDVAYPESMLGRWRVRRSLADVTFPNGEAAAETDVAQMLGRKGTVDSFTVRFIQGKGGVVSDRDFNARALTRASEGADVAVQWKSSNPNVLTVSYPSGILRETKVRGPVGCGASGLLFPTFFCFFSLLDKHEKQFVVELPVFFWKLE